ncbi:MAG: hypothetical protein K8S55_04850 [Phycisphaerae bacterium]|nr:hypothetical protein [Phycisphaerae bacterium]
MKAQTLAEQFAGQLKQIAGWTEYSHVSRVELLLGASYDVAAAELAACLEDILERDFADTDIAAGAAVNVTLVGEGEEFPAPGRDDIQTATGWELLVINIDGHR